MPRPQVALRRSIGLPLLSLYGLGTILGAGIYVLIGEVTANAGMAAPSSFLLASLIAAVTALSYAELSARYPASAGEAVYVDEGFGRPLLTRLVGWAVVAIGLVSAATMSRGFVGYVGVFVSLPDALVVTLVIAALAAIAVWGITESLSAAALITIIEVGGLIFVCVVAGDSLRELPAQWRTLLPSPDLVAVSGVVSGAFVAFYAFIGFEDIVNVAEEVKSPRTILPAAIIVSLIVSTLFYFVVATVAVLSTPIETLSGNQAPLAAIIESQGMPPEIIAAISLLAVLNGALIQIIMASRVLYGMASQGHAPWVFRRINKRTRTPVAGTLLLSSVILLLALFFSLGGLARITSAIALVIFMAVNAALWRVKTKKVISKATFSIPTTVPTLGVALCLGMLAYEVLRLTEVTE